MRDLTIERMIEAFSQKKAVREEKKVDSSALYKKLEADLINTDNSRMELDKKLKEAKSKVADLTEANKRWKTYTVK